MLKSKSRIPDSNQNYHSETVNVFNPIMKHKFFIKAFKTAMAFEFSIWCKTFLKPNKNVSQSFVLFNFFRLVHKIASIQKEQSTFFYISHILSKEISDDRSKDNNCILNWKIKKCYLTHFIFEFKNIVNNDQKSWLDKCHIICL